MELNRLDKINFQRLLMRSLIISCFIFLFFIVGCSQKNYTINDKEIKCEGNVSVKSKSNPEDNISLSRIVTIYFNIRNSKIFYPDGNPPSG